MSLKKLSYLGFSQQEVADVSSPQSSHSQVPVVLHFQPGGLPTPYSTTLTLPRVGPAGNTHTKGPVEAINTWVQNCMSCAVEVHTCAQWWCGSCQVAGMQGPQGPSGCHRDTAEVHQSHLRALRILYFLLSFLKLIYFEGVGAKKMS